MANLNINIPDNFFAELSSVANQLKQTPEQCLLLALSHFLQTSTVENAIEGMARMEDGEQLVDFPELKEELDIDIKFHPLAMDELDTLTEEDQVEILGDLIERIAGRADEEETLDLVLKDQPNSQVVLSGFSFGDIVYQAGQVITIYHIALLEDELEDLDEEEDEEEEEGEEIEDSAAQ